MAAPSALRTNYADLFGSAMLPLLEELFRTSFEQRESVREKIFKKVENDRDIWQYSELHDMPLFASVSEGSDYTFSRPKAGNHKTITPVKYGLGYSVSEETIDDGKFDLIADAIKKMGESARESQEQSAMDILNNGFSTQTVSDGLSLFHSTHTTPTGTVTFRNQLATPSDMSHSSLSTMYQDFKKQFKGDSGIFKDIAPKYLVVPQELEMYAREILGSAKQVDTNYNNINSVGNLGLELIVSPRLTDADAFFMVAAPSDNGLRLVQRKALETKAAAPDSVGFLNDAIYYKARYREKLDAVHAYGIFGTAGA